MKTFITILSLTAFGYGAFAQSERIWTGSEDSTWSNTNNWLNGIMPSTNENVIIQDGGYDAFLDNNVSINNLTIDSGAAFFLESYSITVTGNWTNNGSLNAGFGVVVFAGTLPQQISGNQTFYDIEVDNEAGVQIISGIDSLVGVLTMTNGQFGTNDSLVLISTAEGTASIGSLTNGNLYGEITMQRYLSPEFADWRFLSSPVADKTLNEISDDFWTAGFSGSTYPTSSFTSVYYYDETVTGTADYGYIAPVSINDTLYPGLGFMAYIDSSSLTGIIDFTGVPNMGTISAPVHYTLTDTISDGWNLVGNPYPSAINWDDTSITKTNIYDAIYIWNPETAVYTSYVDGIGANGGSSIIASGQSFYVIAVAASPVLEFTENCKTNEPETFFKAGETNPYFTMSVTNSYGTDETIFRPNANATELFDGSLDAMKMFSSNWNLPSVYSTDSESSYYSINQFSENELEIPVYVNTGVSEMHTISFSGNETFENFTCVFLEDLHTGIVYDLKTTTEITLFISDTTYAPRFILKTGAPFFIAANDATCHNQDNGAINLAKNSNNFFTVNWYDEYGTLLQSDASVYQITTLENLSAGMYVIETTDAICGTLVDTIVVEEPALISAQFSASADTVYAPFESTQIQFTNESSNATYFTWEFGNLGSASETNPSFDFESEGVYEVKLIAWQNATCFKISEQTITVISTLDTPELSDNNPEIYANQNLVFINEVTADRVEVYAMSGQLLVSSVVTDSNLILEVPVSSGQFVIVNVISANAVYSKKVFINQ